MTPIAYFQATWERCAQLTALHAYLANNTSEVLRPDEILRSEWVARVSALDLFVHELIAQRMLEIFEGRRQPTPAYLRFQISNETVDRIRAATTTVDANAAYELEIRTQLSRIVYQDPEKIAEGVRLVSSVELWNEVAIRFGASEATKTEQAKTLKREISLIVNRRNKIAHEGDLQPALPRDPWPIHKNDLSVVKERIEKLVMAINEVVN